MYDPVFQSLVRDESYFNLFDHFDISGQVGFNPSFGMSRTSTKRVQNTVMDIWVSIPRSG